MLLLCLQENCHICCGAVQQNAKRTAVPMARTQKRTYKHTHAVAPVNNRYGEQSRDLPLSLS